MLHFLLSHVVINVLSHGVMLSEGSSPSEKDAAEDVIENRAVVVPKFPSSKKKPLQRREDRDSLNVLCCASVQF